MIDFMWGGMKNTRMIVLGIETSCDETAAAVVKDDGTILSNIILSQLEDHKPYGGVVPEIAARAHLDHLDSIIQNALDEAGVRFQDLDGIAATAGPGLVGGVMVGLMTAKAIALAAKKPLIGVNHLEGHALTPRLTDQVAFPYLLLLVSGGHTQILLVKGVGEYQLLGTTIDDACGEAFDKVAKMLGIGYPGGPQLEKLSQKASEQGAKEFNLPRPLKGREGCDFSFAGLKTAVRTMIQKTEMNDQTRADIALSFHISVGDVLIDRLGNALDMIQECSPTALVVAGGVAANKYLCDRLRSFANQHDLPFIAPPLNLCTDNAAMIAWAGVERLQAGLTDTLDIKARPRWPLDELTGKGIAA